MRWPTVPVAPSMPTLSLVISLFLARVGDHSPFSINIHNVRQRLHPIFFEDASDVPTDGIRLRRFSQGKDRRACAAQRNSIQSRRAEREDFVETRDERRSVWLVN